MLEIKEGLARINAPQKGPERGPASSDVDVFYNPAMALCRDICTLAVDAIGLDRPLRVLDGLSGTGVRSIRLALESQVKFETIIANDRSSSSCELLMENIEKNGVGHVVSPSKSDLNALLASERFDYIDIDPFGPPVEFLLPAVLAVRHGGMVGITATDTGPLCGTHPNTCVRRYGAISVRSEYMHETASRILAGYCIRTAASVDIALRPLLVSSDDHYIRIYFRAERSAARTNKVLRELGYFTKDRRMLKMDEGAPSKGAVAGPLWLGELFDPEFIGKVAKMASERTTFCRPRQLARMVGLMQEEAMMPAFFYETDTVAQRLRTGPPGLTAIIEGLKKDGYRASRTHFCPTGFRTDATQSQVEAVFSALKRI